MFGIRYIAKGIKYGAAKCSQAYRAVTRISMKPAKPKTYQLLERTELPIAAFPDDSWCVPEGSVRFRRVRIGKTKDPNYDREIVSFYDDQGRIITRFQKGNDIPRSKRTYEYSQGVTNDCNKVNITRVHTAQFIPEQEGSNYGIWAHVSDEQRYVREQYILKKKRLPFPKKLHITRTDYDPDNSFRRIIKLTEYPTNQGVETKAAKKEMKIGLTMDYKDGQYIPNVTEISSSSNIQVPENDEFLGFRFLRGKTKQESLARYFIGKKGLSDAKINVTTSSFEVNQGIAHFDPYGDGYIRFKDIIDTPVNTAAHEAEHAWQYSIMGRAFGRTPYEQKCKELYGSLDTPELQAEAQKLAQADAIYPAKIETAEGEINPEYWNNYLEVKAREAGKKAQELYDKGRDFILRQFRTIPTSDM